jgi:hypothetical protein
MRRGVDAADHSTQQTVATVRWDLANLDDGRLAYKGLSTERPSNLGERLPDVARIAGQRGCTQKRPFLEWFKPSESSAEGSARHSPPAK